jgi:hypothetical protein
MCFLHRGADWQCSDCDVVDAIAIASRCDVTFSDCEITSIVIENVISILARQPLKRPDWVRDYDVTFSLDHPPARISGRERERERERTHVTYTPLLENVTS